MGETTKLVKSILLFGSGIFNARPGSSQGSCLKMIILEREGESRQTCLKPTFNLIKKYHAGCRRNQNPGFKPAVYMSSRNLIPSESGISMKLPKQQIINNLSFDDFQALARCILTSSSRFLGAFLLLSSCFELFNEEHLIRISYVKLQKI